MKTILSIITGLSVISLMGCNNLNRNDNNEDVLSGVDTTEITPTSSDNLATDEVDVNDSIASAQMNRNDESDSTYVETEVVQIDTVGSEVAYDINRRTVEQVDTVGATTTYQVERKVIKKTVLVDTIVETVDKERNVVYEEGNYQDVDEKIEKDTVTEEVSIEEARQLNSEENTPASDENQGDNEQRSEDETAMQTAQDSTTNIDNNNNEVRSEETELDSAALDSADIERETANEPTLQDTTTLSKEISDQINEEDTTSGSD